MGHSLHLYIQSQYEVKIKISALRIHRDLTVRIYSQTARTREEMDTRTKNWFQEIINKIQEFDNFSSSILDG